VTRAVAVLVGAALASCATAPLAPDAAVNPRGYWTVVAVNGEATGGGEQFHFIVTPPTGSAQFGCNAGGGSLTAANGWLVAGDWIITAAGCRTTQLARFEHMGFDVTAKPMAVEKSVQGIRLRNENGTIDLTPRAFPSLMGRWRVLSVNGRPVVGSAHMATDRSILNFGCNDLLGAYRQDGERLVVIPPISTTERGCVTNEGSPTEAALHEDEGFRIAARHMRVTFFGPDRVRLSNEAGTIELSH
jgi:heat shock protein HslJ